MLERLKTLWRKLKAYNAQDRALYFSIKKELLGEGEREHAGQTRFEILFLWLFVWALFIVLAAIIVGFVDGWLLQIWSFVDEKGNADNGENIRNLFLALAGLIGAVFGLFQLHNSARRTRISIGDAQTKMRDAQTRIEQERNERYVRSAELLSHDDPSLRMAGIYALERLAYEQSSGYVQTVIDLLAGYVRDRTIRADYPSRPKATSDEKATEKPDRWKAPTEPISAAVIALDRIWRAKNDQKSKGKLNKIDLRGAQLPRLEVRNLKIRQWLLNKANFDHCHFYWGTNLRNGNFQQASFIGCFMDSVRLNDSDLWGADYNGAKLEDANFDNSDVSSANFEHAVLSNASLRRTNARYAMFNGAKMGNADLSCSELENAKFGDAHVEDANLKGANLSGASLQNIVGLSRVQLADAVWASENPPRLPKEFKSSQFDKSIYTDEKNRTKLKKNLYNDVFEYIGPHSKKTNEMRI